MNYMSFDPYPMIRQRYEEMLQEVRAVGARRATADGVRAARLAVGRSRPERRAAAAAQGKARRVAHRHKTGLAEGGTPNVREQK